MVKTSDKSRVLTHMQTNGEQTTAKVAVATGIPHPSVRRILNELRTAGEVKRGSVHGKWISLKQLVEETEEEVNTVDAETAAVEDDTDPLNIDDRPDAAEETVVTSFFKVVAEDDTIYVEAASAEAAKTGIVNSLGIPEALLTVTQVDEVPEGEDLFLLPQFVETPDESNQ